MLNQPVGNSKRYVSLLHQKGTSGASFLYVMRCQVCGNIVYNRNDDRMHAFCMLGSNPCMHYEQIGFVLNRKVPQGEPGDT